MPKKLELRWSWLAACDNQTGMRAHGNGVNLLFDARVIQDHFPGIGRYAVNLLSELPHALDEQDAVTVLHDPTRMNTRYPEYRNRIQDKRITWQECRVPVFSIKNLLVPAAPSGQSQLTHFTYYVRPLRTSGPSVTTIYDAISFVYPGYIPSARARLIIRLMHQLAVNRSDAFLTISQSAASDLAKYFPRMRGRTHVTPLAADATFVPQSEDAQQTLRARLQLPERFALYLASNKPHKNLDKLVGAWAELARGGAVTPLVIAGPNDPRFPQASARARQLGVEGLVHVVGDVPETDLPALYSACALFVYPSLYEGFGLTPLEAMACGAPVVCSNASSLPEVVGTAAVMFDATQPGEIAHACTTILGDASKTTELRARSLAQAATFSWRRCACETVAAYRSIAR